MPKFTGYNDVAPAVWLEKYAIFATSKGWNPQQTLNNVGLYLGDGPYTWYRNLPPATKNNLANLQAAFDNKYMQHDGVEWALRAELSEKKQGSTETVEEYAEDIERRCGQLNIHGQQMMEAFVRGLRPALRAAVIKDQPGNLTEAINSARVAQSLTVHNEDHETVVATVQAAMAEQMKLLKDELAVLTVNAVEQQQQQRNNFSRPRPFQQQQSQVSQQQRQRQQQFQPRPMQRKYYDQQQPNSFPFRQQQQQCYRCGKSDHVPYQCFAINVSCHYCGKMGHLVRMCRAKQANFY